jgi:hypothetical protein
MTNVWFPKPLHLLGGVFIVYFMSLIHLSALDSPRIEAGFTVEPEINRAFSSAVSFASFGAFKVNSRFILKGGVSLGTTGNIFDMKGFTKTEAVFPLPVPLSVSVHYIYNGMPAYKTHIQSLAPLISFKSRWVGVSFGPAWHFITFNRKMVAAEPVFAFSWYVNFYHTDKGRIGLRCANLTDFVSGNTGAYWVQLSSRFSVTPICSFINDLTVYQSGSIGLSAAFYGLAYRGGIVFTW